jgi:hypothetical protein
MGTVAGIINLETVDRFKLGTVAGRTVTGKFGFGTIAGIFNLGLVASTLNKVQFVG